MTPLRILLVEDNAEVRRCLRTWLTDAGCEVVESETRAAAADLAPLADAVVLDLSLPDSPPRSTALWGLALVGAGVSVVLHTGYPEQTDAAVMGRSRVPVLTKGDSREAVLSVVLDAAVEGAERRALRDARHHLSDAIRHLRAVGAALGAEVS